MQIEHHGTIYTDTLGNMLLIEDRVGLDGQPTTYLLQDGPWKELDRCWAGCPQSLIDVVKLEGYSIGNYSTEQEKIMSGQCNSFRVNLDLDLAIKQAAEMVKALNQVFTGATEHMTFNNLYFTYNQKLPIRWMVADGYTTDIGCNDLWEVFGQWLDVAMLDEHLTTPPDESVVSIYRINDIEHENLIFGQLVDRVDFNKVALLDKIAAAWLALLYDPSSTKLSIMQLGAALDAAEALFVNKTYASSDIRLLPKILDGTAGDFMEQLKVFAYENLDEDEYPDDACPQHRMANWLSNISKANGLSSADRILAMIKILFPAETPLSLDQPLVLDDILEDYLQLI